MSEHGPSPVVNADVRFAGSPPDGLYVDVRFTDRAEIDALIEALIRLRDGEPGEPDHVHLQYPGLAPGHAAEQGEVVFYRPGLLRDETDAALVNDAARWLSGDRSDKA